MCCYSESFNVLSSPQTVDAFVHNDRPLSSPHTHWHTQGRSFYVVKVESARIYSPRYGEYLTSVCLYIFKSDFLLYDPLPSRSATE